ncbi:hypothetical protein ACJVC5_14995 [Peredibacter sp. HCB2-198]|uniref:hypothetical protein n=1 Tax=Peredibacter sp. HCB2-198 TaxID=3383025 RepID=UPI0038B4A26B
MKKNTLTPITLLLTLSCFSLSAEAISLKKTYFSRVQKKSAPKKPVATAPLPTTQTTTTQTTTTPDPLLTRVFSATSPWNTPIGENPVYEPNSAAMMELVKMYVQQGGYAPVLGLNYKQWTAPLHFIDSTTAPKRTVYFDTAKVGYHEGFHNSVDPLGIGEVPNIPMPTSVWPDPKADGHMIMYDTATGTIYEFSRFRWDSTGKALATRVAIFESTSEGTQVPFDGSRWWMKNVRGSGMPFIGGLIRYTEFQSGEIKHALSMAGPTNRLKKLASNTWSKELCAPMAARTDGWEIGDNTILEGARIQLNPNLDLDSLNLSADAKVVARALQKYGAFMADNSPTLSLYFQNLGTNSYLWEQTQLGDLTKIPLSEFKVLKCDDIRTKQ